MNAIIIGGGVAGAAAALALHRAGVETAVYEARPTPSDGVGAWLTLAVNGVAVLRELGVRPLAGIPTPGMQLGLGDGTALTEFPMGEGTMSVRRTELYGALLDAVREAGIPIHYGRRIVGLDTTDSSATAHFADGATATGSLLVGADGIGSTVRSLLDPRAPKARYLGLLNTGGFASGIEVPTPPGLMHMMFGRDTFFSWLASDDGDVWWFANPARRREPDRAELAGISGEAWRSTLLDLVRRDDPVATRVLEASDDLLPAWPMYDFPRVPVWHRGAAVLIGDAAHAASPSSGQGASMALEDGLALGLLLAEAGAGGGTGMTGTTGPRAGIPAALARYEALRRPRVERVIAQGKASSSGKAPGAFRPVRDAMLRAYFSKPRATTDTAWLWEYRVADAVAGARA
ncbi:2-polyprenyl-6-methoxyphenol hydroxylase [Agromyces sp. CF514]|uniref:FAD-dependent oxidoreductase n=1 Tax=Agromyces sp. CF514 TaxID=1881031 RepID=UPI0008ED40CC|nr:FAD-dependent monooxygenase [Agromyces sp. CF514]SFR85751.1 2-polyprenyl-6-methoxyphenol hydroxylase [Agromyces sp. CF514]